MLASIGVAFLFASPPACAEIIKNMDQGETAKKQLSHAANRLQGHPRTPHADTRTQNLKELRPRSPCSGAASLLRQSAAAEAQATSASALAQVLPRTNTRTAVGKQC